MKNCFLVAVLAFLQLPWRSLSQPLPTVRVTNHDNLTFTAKFRIGSVNQLAPFRMREAELLLDTGSSIFWVTGVNAQCQNLNQGPTAQFEKCEKPEYQEISKKDQILSANYGAGWAYGYVGETQLRFADEELESIFVSMNAGFAEVISQPAAFFKTPEAGYLGLGLPYNIWTCPLTVCGTIQSALSNACQLCGNFTMDGGPRPLGNGGLQAQENINFVYNMVKRFGRLQMNFYLPMAAENEITFNAPDTSRYHEGTLVYSKVEWPPTVDYPAGMPGYWQIRTDARGDFSNSLVALDSGASAILFSASLWDSGVQPRLNTVPGYNEISIPGFPMLYSVPKSSIPLLPSFDFYVQGQKFTMEGYMYAIFERPNIAAIFYPNNVTIPGDHIILRIAHFDTSALGIDILLGSPFMQWHYTSFVAENASVAGAQVGIARAKVPWNNASVFPPAPTNVPTATPTAMPTNDESQKRTVGLGLGLGAGLGTLLIFLLAISFISSSHQHHRPSSKV